MKILADSTLPLLEETFCFPFELSLYKDIKEVSDRLNNYDILVCRANLKVSRSLVEPSSLRFVATASSGTDHIDKIFLKERNIELFDAKGTNASSVADYVLACLAYLKQYEGFQPKKAGIIGVGMVGSLVANYLKNANLEIIYHDPLRNLVEPQFKSNTLEEIAVCDLICLHPNLHQDPLYPSFHLIDDYFLNHLKPGAVIINASRGDVVDEEALLSKLSKGSNEASKNTFSYCTDVFSNEPFINPKVVKLSTLCTPHIAGHSIEAKQESVRTLGRKIYSRLGISIPESLKVNTNLPSIPFNLNDSGWENFVLSQYNPNKESTLLKKLIQSSTPLGKAFLALRQDHRFRHSFHSITR